MDSSGTKHHFSGQHVPSFVGSTTQIGRKPQPVSVPKLSCIGTEVNIHGQDTNGAGDSRFWNTGQSKFIDTRESRNFHQQKIWWHWYCTTQPLTTKREQCLMCLFRDDYPFWEPREKSTRLCGVQLVSHTDNLEGTSTHTTAIVFWWGFILKDVEIIDRSSSNGAENSLEGFIHFVKQLCLPVHKDKDSNSKRKHRKNATQLAWAAFLLRT